MKITDEKELFERIRNILAFGQEQVVRTVNTALLHTYWWIGYEIVEYEQGGEVRAEYGENVLQNLSKLLVKEFGKGFSVQNLRRMRQFYLTYPQGSALLAKQENGDDGLEFSHPKGGLEKRSTVLSESFQKGKERFPDAMGWSHYLILMKVTNEQARSFYEIEAAREGWSVRELERQIASLLYERLAKSRNKEEVLALARKGQEITKAKDVIKDPMILEFLGLEERASWLEKDLEKAIMDGLEAFLLELGKGFCFVARQRRLTIEGDHFYVDLVFYNRLLRSFVLIDLKLGKLTHQDIGQMQMYVNYFDRYHREEWESPTVGILLCSEKNDTMVKITLPEENQQVLASRYQLYLPTETELKEKVTEERGRVEQVKSVLQIPATGKKEQENEDE